MASISNEDGKRTIRFVLSDGKRRRIHLGKCDHRTAQGVQIHVEHLVLAKENAMPVHPDTMNWLRSIGDELHDRLAAVGLCTARLDRGRGAMTLSTMLEAYILRRERDMKPWSILMLKQARRKLVAFFASERTIGSITAAEANDFRRKLLADKLSVAFVSKVIRLSRQFFNDAVDRELIEKNPFSGVKPGSQKNPARQRFITRETIDKAIEHAPDTEWKLIIALARYGGLRTPTESMALRWEDVKWDEGKIVIHSSKTEHHPGRGERVVPLFPELRPLLLAAFNKRPPDAIHVLQRYRRPAMNLRTGFLRILKSADIDAWPKLFQNLRSTRQTELAETWPSHVVCSWLGNTERIAMGHYLQTTEDHVRRAAGMSSTSSNQNGAVVPATQSSASRAESGPARARPGSHLEAPRSDTKSISVDFVSTNDNVLADASTCESHLVGAVGFEPTKA